VEHQVVSVLGRVSAGAGWVLRFADAVKPGLLWSPVGACPGVGREGVFSPCRAVSPVPRGGPQGFSPGFVLLSEAFPCDNLGGVPLSADSFQGGPAVCSLVPWYAYGSRGGGS